MRFAFMGASVVWLALLATAPTAALGVPVSGAVYAFGSLICHQRPERSFHVGVAQLPVCARCYGIYLGAAIGALAAPGLLRTLRRAPRPRFTRADLRRVIVYAAVPTALTWLGEVAGVWTFSNIVRFLAALPFGAAVALTVNYVECARPRRNGSRVPHTPLSS